MNIRISPGLTIIFLWIALVAFIALPIAYLNAYLFTEVWGRTAVGNGPWSTTGHQLALIVGDMAAAVILLWKGMGWSHTIETAHLDSESEKRCAANRAAAEKRNHDRHVEVLVEQLATQEGHTDEARTTIATLQQQISDLTKELKA